MLMRFSRSHRCTAAFLSLDRVDASRRQRIVPLRLLRPGARPHRPRTRAPTLSSNGELVVAPGLHIPNGNVPWALDTIAGKQVLVPIHHAQLTASGSTAPGTLEGAASHTSLHSDFACEFFIHTSDRTENTGDCRARHAHRLGAAGGAGVRSAAHRPSCEVCRCECGQPFAPRPVLCTVAETLPDGWLRITPRDPLPVGEYVLLPVPRTATSQSPLVYDFSVERRRTGGKGCCRSRAESRCAAHEQEEEKNISSAGCVSRRASVFSTTPMHSPCQPLQASGLKPLLLMALAEAMPLRKQTAAFPNLSIRPGV